MFKVAMKISWFSAWARTSRNCGAGRIIRSDVEKVSKVEPRPQRNQWRLSSSETGCPIAASWSQRDLNFLPKSETEDVPFLSWRRESRRVCIRSTEQ
ncbi:hypothetical protein HanXRQr2_Chr09g0381971 [Helianthus annuus]|uniref:Uncharacterized protein n=1 Tax=Helianthus annuus TaxID=4232 RepID=A0A9K3I5R4_HELAN|nr:hypothetical protein HanXRQr2_Chr09g0381971 [Helianthus annuus]